MTEKTYKRKHLYRGWPTVSEDESMTVIWEHGGRKAGRHWGSSQDLMSLPSSRRESATWELR